MVREISAGGVVIRKKKEDGRWWMAAIELPMAPALDHPPGKRPVRTRAKPTLCLPKGLIDAPEKALDAAVREVGTLARRAPVTGLWGRKANGTQSTGIYRDPCRAVTGDKL